MMMFFVVRQCKLTHHLSSVKHTYAMDIRIFFILNEFVAGLLRTHSIKWNTMY